MNKYIDVITKFFVWLVGSFVPIPFYFCIVVGLNHVALENEVLYTILEYVRVLILLYACNFLGPRKKFLPFFSDALGKTNEHG